MWKQAAVAAALVALAGGCEDRNARTPTSGRVYNDRTSTTTAPSTGTTITTETTATATLAQTDAEFLRKAASINSAEVELGNLARERSQNQDVKMFCDMLIKDHTDSGNRLKDIADRNKGDFPAEVLPEHKAVKDQLQSLSGPQFDLEFCKAMVDGHQQAIDLFQKEASDGQNADLKSYAQTTLPTLRQHLDHARELQRKVSAGGQDQTQQPGMNPDQPPAQPQQPPEQPPSPPPSSVG